MRRTARLITTTALLGLLTALTGCSCSGDEQVKAPPRKARTPLVQADEAPAQRHFAPLGAGESSIVFVGSTYPGGALSPIMKSKGFDYPYGALTSLFGQAQPAAVVGALESPLTTSSGKRLPNGAHWSANPKRAADLAEAGFTHLSLATHHILDRRIAGLRDTFKSLEDAGIVSFGAGENAKQAWEPLYITAGETEVAIIGAMFPFKAHAKAHWGANSKRPGVALAYEKTLKKAIKQARKNADVVIFYPHWGKGYDDVRKGQRRLWKVAREAGVDAVIGHHTLQAQRVALAKGGRVPVLWSLGVGPWGGEARWRRDQGQSLVARVVFKGKRIDRVELVALNARTEDNKGQIKPLGPQSAVRFWGRMKRWNDVPLAVNESTGVATLQVGEPTGGSNFNSKRLRTKQK